jgi:ABC-type transport system substrate-binding protein
VSFSATTIEEEEKMEKKPVLAIMLATLLALSIFIAPFAPTRAWVYPDGTQDDLFEMFGPRIDNLLINLYPSEWIMWDALISGEIDITDQPLTWEQYQQFTQPPYSDYINVVFSGIDLGFFMLDINNNEYLHSVYPNPCSVLRFRQAIAYLVNRSYIVDITKGFGIPIWTPMPPSLSTFVHPDIKPGGALESLTYGGWTGDINKASELLDMNGFPIGDDGWRFWDRDGYRIYLELKLVIPIDDTYARLVGEFIASQLEAVRVRVNRIFCDEQNAQNLVKRDKDFHLYIGYYKVGPYPDYFTNWNSEYYWHPGYCPNYIGANNSEFDNASYGVKYATSWQEAYDQALRAQKIFAENVLSVPLFSVFINEAYRRSYVGQEYYGINWTNLVNQMGYGIDNYWTLLNMHPDISQAYLGEAYDSTIRWGLSTYALWLNPIYIRNIYEQKILDLIYEPLLRFDPNFVLQPCLAESFSVTSYYHPAMGECTCIRISLPNDVYWHDDVPVTVLDAYFTLVELKEILDGEGCPPPSWIPNVKNIIGFKIYDPYNFEVLFNIRSIWAPYWLANVPILPRHIWFNLVNNWSQQDWEMPDSKCIGSGPWKFSGKNEGAFIWLKRKVGDGLKWILGVVGNYLIETLEFKTRLKKILIGAAKNFIKELRNNIKQEALKRILGEPPNIGVDVHLYYKKPPMNKWEWLGSATVDLQNLGDVGQVAEVISINLAILAVGPLYVKTDVRIWACVGNEIWERWFKETRGDCCIIWFTIYEDIVGSNFYDDMNYTAYPYKNYLPTPDFKVDIYDLVIIALAFDSVPGDSRWSPVADLNADYRIDIFDLVLVALKFGWQG